MTNAPAASVDVLLKTPLFADVDKKLLEAVRKEAAITAGGYEWPPGVAKRLGFVRFQELAAGEAAIGQGDRTTELVIVLDGQIEAIQARAAQSPRQHRAYGPGEWFGEVSAHSHHPALATYRALTPTTIAALEARLFSTLYAEDDEFKTRIDEGYRDNLALHLGASSLCRELDDRALQALQAEAKLVTADEGEVIAEEGKPTDTVFLVRAGAVACTVAGERGERTLAFYKGNATFGEHAVVSPEAAWPATYKAMMRTALVALPRRTFEKLDTTAQKGLARAANRLIGRDDAAMAAGGDADQIGGRSVLDELHVMVERESVKGGRALVIDRSKCVRCNMCVESCVAVHDDHVPRLSKVGTTVTTNEVLITACYHCELPQCMLSCEYAAIRRDPQGRVRFEYDNCVGCASCIDGCPYGVIRLVEPAPPPPPVPSFWASLPLVGRLFAEAAATASAAAPPAAGSPAAAPQAAGAEPPKPRSAGVGAKLNTINGKTIKCDLCAGLPFEACVYNCPTTAILRREPQSLFDRGRLDRGQRR